MPLQKQGDAEGTGLRGAFDKEPPTAGGCVPGGRAAALRQEQNQSEKHESLGLAR